MAAQPGGLGNHPKRAPQFMNPQFHSRNSSNGSRSLPQECSICRQDASPLGGGSCKRRAGDRGALIGDAGACCGGAVG